VPLYEYQCTKCGHRFEKIESVSSSPKKKCPKCGRPAERLASAPAIQFKGAGWYVTDYAGKSAGADGSKAEKSEKTGKSEKTTETTKAEPVKDSGASKKKTDH